MNYFKQLSYQLLRASEKVFKTDMVYLAKGGFWLSLGQLIAVGSSFILSIVFANLLSKDTYGSYKYILSVTSILSTFSLAGLGTAVVQAVAKGNEGTLKAAVKTSLRWSVLIVLLALGSAGYYYWIDETILAMGFLIAGIFLPIINAYSLYSSLLNGRQDFKQTTIFWSISQCLLVGGLILMAFIHPTVLGLVMVYFAISAVSAAFFYDYVNRKMPANTQEDPSLLSYGKHLSYMNIINTLANQLDKILVFHIVGPVQLANYAFALAIPEQIKGSYKNLFNLALPKYALHDRVSLRASVMDKILRLTLLTVLVVLAYIMGAQLIFDLLFPQYSDVVIYSQVYALGLLMVPGISLFSTYFQVQQATLTLYKLNLIANIVTIALGIYLISQFGVWGAVIENTISWFVMLLVNAYFFFTERA